MNKKIEKTHAQWKQQLSDKQYYITRQKGTEHPHTGKYNKYAENGEYLCVCCGQTLFGSDAKYDSGSGWPSFWRAQNPHAISEQADHSLGMQRTEILCSSCDAHLGHVFPDGPQPSGLRYCVNSAALDFAPTQDNNE